MRVGVPGEQKSLKKNMHVVHIAGVPPNHGKKYFPSTSCTANRRKAPRKIVNQ
jgi:hypothetical protein